MARVRRLAAGRAGHGGTLDPDAAGVLPVAIGQSLALLGRIDWSPKTYAAVARFGALTDTLDAAGAIVARSAPPWPGRADLERSAPFLVGAGLQLPPQRSAIRQHGERAHRRARRGENFFLAPRPVVVHSLTVTDADGALFRFVAEVSSGTYVRALVRDWAQMLGQAASLVALIRTRAGPFGIEEAVTLEELQEDGIEQALRSWQAVWSGPRLELAAAEVAGVLRGRFPSGLEPENGVLTALTREGRLYALTDGPQRFVRVFPEGLS